MSSVFSAGQHRQGSLAERWLPQLQERHVVLATAVLYLVLIAAAEVVTTFAEPRVGLAMHGGLLVIMLLHCALASGGSHRALVLSLSLAPLIRMLSLSMPLVGFPLLYWYLIISVPLFVATALAARTLGFSRRELGLDIKRVPLQVLVALTGLTFGMMEYHILRPEPLIDSLDWRSMLVPSLILIACTGFGEELIFRGLMQRASVHALGRFGVFYVALLFAVLHVGYRSPVDMAFVFGVALLFGWAAEQTGSLMGVSLSHGLTNVVLFLIMPFLGV